MITFDLGTVFFAAIALCLLMSILQMLSWLHVRTEPALAIWSCANLACAVGGGVLAFQDGYRNPYLASAASACFLFAAGLTYWGMRSFDREPTGRRVWGLVLGVPACYMAIAVVLVAYPDTRIAIFSAFCSLWLAASAWRLARLPPYSPTFSRLTVSVFLSGMAALQLSRMIGSIIGVRALAGRVAPEQLAMVLAFGLFCVIGLNFGAIFMVLDRLASRDELTGLMNRRALIAWGQALLKSAGVRRRPLTVMLADLDHFKSINDRYGHGMGDRVLALFAEIAQGTVRRGDLVGRYGGEEFCIILAGADAERAVTIAERLRERVAQRMTHMDGRALGATVSIGVARFAGPPPAPENIHVLIDAADHALYTAKAGGRNRVVHAPACPQPQLAAPMGAVQPTS